MERTLTIEQLGRHGEGVARLDGARVFVPYALAGETVHADIDGERGRLLDVIEPAPDRVQPFCPHFGTCGGCALQHMAPAAYAAWKREIVVTALANRGIETPVSALRDAHGRGRRRATFHAVSTRSGPVAGFTAARSHRIVALDACPILVPELAAAPRLAGEIAAAIDAQARLDILVTASDSGLDVHVGGLKSIGLPARAALAALAQDRDLARIARGGEPVIERRPVRLRMGKATVQLPPGTFLQPTQAGEDTLAELVLEHLRGARRAADLFAGIGPFALRLAAEATVYAADSDRTAIAALSQAARTVSGLRPVEAEARNLFTRALQPAELARFDAVVFDPPRAGAEAQARALAASRVERIAAVSCDPASFARDAGILIAGGYRLLGVHPVDQFKWSPHVEIVGLLERH